MGMGEIGPDAVASATTDAFGYMTHLQGASDPAYGYDTYGGAVKGRGGTRNVCVFTCLFIRLVVHSPIHSFVYSLVRYPRYLDVKVKSKKNIK